MPSFLPQFMQKEAEMQRWRNFFKDDSFLLKLVWTAKSGTDDCLGFLLTWELVVHVKNTLSKHRDHQKQAAF